MKYFVKENSERRRTIAKLASSERAFQLTEEEGGGLPV